jgi:PAS domain S-box-containing protein
LDQTSDAVLWIEESGKIFDVNKAACDSLDYTKEELLTLSVPDIDPDFTAKHWEDYWKNYCHNHTCFQTRHRTKNGRSFPVEIMGDFIEYNDKLYRCVFVRDISERKRVEEALRENEERFRSLVENTMDWFWEVDANARIIYSSPRVFEFIGYTPEEDLKIPLL